MTDLGMERPAYRPIDFKIVGISVAHPNLHRGQAKSLLKRGLISQKAHDAMMAKIAAMDAAAQAQAPAGPVDGAVNQPQGAQIPATASVPGAPMQQGDVTKPVQPPAV